MTSEGLSHLSSQLSKKMETITAEYFRTLLTEAMEEGIVDKNLDKHITAFCIDNLIITLQYSYTSQYFSEGQPEITYL